MAYGLNDDPLLRRVDPVADPVVTTSGSVESFEVKPKRAADALRRLGQRSVDELDRGECNLFWQPGDGSLGRARPLDRVELRRLLTLA